MATEEVRRWRLIHQGKLVCIHRQSRIGKASCGMGPIHGCGLLGGFCGSQTPVDDLVDVKLNDGRPPVLLKDAGYRKCADCRKFQGPTAIQETQVSEA